MVVDGSTVVAPNAHRTDRGDSEMQERAPIAHPERHAYVEGVHIRTGRDGRVYRLCRVCDDRANAGPHRGFRTTPATPRERAERHPFDESSTVFVSDARGHRTPACLTCGKTRRATEHGGLSAPLPPVVPTDPATPRPLRVVTDAPLSAPPRTAARPRPTKITPPAAEIAMVALAIDRLLAMPEEAVDVRLRMRLSSARELLACPPFPTMDVRLTDPVDPLVQADDDDPLAAPSIVATFAPRRPLEPDRAIGQRSVVAGIRSDKYRELARRALQAGFTAHKTGSGHLSLDKGGTRIILSMTAETGRRGHSWGNARAEAKRAGIDVTGL